MSEAAPRRVRRPQPTGGTLRFARQGKVRQGIRRQPWGSHTPGAIRGKAA